MTDKKANENDKPRIGVFVCSCGSNIGGFVDVPTVADYAKTLPDVVYATQNMYTCAEDGLSSIREAIRKHNLNRVIVASCTPRTHAPLFQATCEGAGLNKYLFTFVNIREHCSWVHMKEKDLATKKARDLIRMGVARARLLMPQEEVKVEVEPVGLVIGGGVSGMSAAVSMADMGFPVHIVEKDVELGGFVRLLNNLYVTEKGAAETIAPLIAKVKGHKNITLHLSSTVKSVEGFIGNYTVGIAPKGGEEKKLKVGTIVVATGALEFVPEGLYGYNQYPNVVTLTEFEILCKRKTLPKLKSVAFIQCVGSRGQKVSYCSRICCNVAIKNAINIVDNYEGMLGVMEKQGTLVDKIPVEKALPISEESISELVERIILIQEQDGQYSDIPLTYKNMSDWATVVPVIPKQGKDYTVQCSFDILSSGRRVRAAVRCWLRGGMNEVQGAVTCRRQERQGRSGLRGCGTDGDGEPLWRCGQRVARKKRSCRRETHLCEE